MENEIKFDYYLLGKRLSEASRKGIIKQVNTFLLWVESESIPDVTEVSYNDILAFVKHCNGQGNTQKTIALKLYFLHYYFMWLIKEGEMIENPISNIRIKGIQRKHLHHVLKREQLDDLYGSFAAPDILGMRNKVIIGMIVFQALRVKELTNLTVGDILIKEAKVRVNPGRKGTSRTMALEAHQMADLLQYLHYGRSELLQLTGKTTDRVFTSSRSGDKLINTLSYILAQLKRQSPVVRDWKQIRASVITHWITAHGLRKAQYLAGHRYISSTEEYQQQNIDELQGDIDRFHPLQ